VKIPISLDASTGKSFIAGMQNWTTLSHPNIVGLYDFNIMPMPYFEREICDDSLAAINAAMVIQQKKKRYYRAWAKSQIFGRDIMERQKSLGKTG